MGTMWGASVCFCCALLVFFLCRDDEPGAQINTPSRLEEASLIPLLSASGSPRRPAGAFRTRNERGPASVIAGRGFEREIILELHLVSFDGSNVLLTVPLCGSRPLV